ncbi:MAG: DUF167 domain-containing protein [Candidatus Omnitrophica bacterium]|nr:DUF167 domain-containing protein [Candidatus Omnitrophota bacterium]
MTVKVTPKSSRSELHEEEGALKAYLRSAPDKGKANKELIELISDKFDIPKKNVKIISGLTSKTKIVEVLGI